MTRIEKAENGFVLTIRTSTGDYDYKTVSWVFHSWDDLIEYLKNNPIVEEKQLPSS